MGDRGLRKYFTKDVLEDVCGFILVGGLALGSLFFLYKGLEECNRVVPKSLYNVPAEYRR